MKASIIIATLFSIVYAAPVAQSTSTSGAINEITSGAGNFAGDFLKGDMASAVKGLGHIVTGAMSIPAGLFNDASKGASH